MLTLAEARAGMTVFLPSPVKPPTIPFASRVGRLPVRSSARKPSSPSSAFAPDVRFTVSA